MRGTEGGARSFVGEETAGTLEELKEGKSMIRIHCVEKNAFFN